MNFSSCCPGKTQTNTTQSGLHGQVPICSANLRSQENRHRNWLFTNFYNNLRIIFMSVEFKEEKQACLFIFLALNLDCVFQGTSREGASSLWALFPLLAPPTLSAIQPSSPLTELWSPRSSYTPFSPLHTADHFLLPQACAPGHNPHAWSSRPTGCSLSPWPFCADGLELRAFFTILTDLSQFHGMKGIIFLISWMFIANVCYTTKFPMLILFLQTCGTCLLVPIVFQWIP